jgi:hypothetical protein
MAGTQPFSLLDAAAWPYVAGVPAAPGTNEVQTVTITGTPTGGDFTLTFDGQTTADIAYNASASAVQSALEALSSIGAGNVLCAGGALPGTAVTVTFQDALGGTSVAAMTADDSGLTGGTTPAVAVTETTPGAVGGKVDIVAIKSIEQSMQVETVENRGDGQVLASTADLSSIDLTITTAAYTPVSIAAISGGTVSTTGVGSTAVTKLSRKSTDVVPYFKAAGQTRTKDADGGAARVTYGKVSWQGGPDFAFTDNEFAEFSIAAKAIPDASRELYAYEAYATWTGLV